MEDSWKQNYWEVDSLFGFFLEKVVESSSGKKIGSIVWTLVPLIFLHLQIPIMISADSSSFCLV